MMEQGDFRRSLARRDDIVTLCSTECYFWLLFQRFGNIPCLDDLEHGVYMLDV